MNECEEYNVKLVSAIGLELSINPDYQPGKGSGFTAEITAVSAGRKLARDSRCTGEKARFGGPQDWNDLKWDELLVRCRLGLPCRRELARVATQIFSGRLNSIVGDRYA
jgi:hypothetical protein